MSSQQQDTSYTYRFGEKININNIDRLISEIGPKFESPNINPIILDCENVRECSSHGLKLFLSFKRRADVQNKSLIFYRPSKILLNILSMTGLDRVFSITDKPRG